MSDKIQLEIVTPDRQFFSGEVDEISVPGAEGYMGILPGHAPLLSELKVGVISYKADGDQTRLFSDWGFVEVLPGRVTVLCEKVETPAEIDVEKSRLDREEAQGTLESKDLETDFKAALNDFQKAQARLDVAGARS